MIERGDLIVVLYAADARVERTRWIFDRFDKILARSKGPFLVLMVITEDAGPPDAATRAENMRRFRQVEASIRLIVTVTTGDDFKANIVRTIMRAMLVLLGHSSRHRIVRNAEEGISEISRVATANTPAPRQIHADVNALVGEVRKAAA